MGQKTHGVLYGAKLTALGEHTRDAIRAAGADLVWVERTQSQLVLRTDGKSFCLAGFWLAVGGHLKTVQFSEIPVAYSERYDAAKAAWPQVEAAVAAAGVKDFGPPGFWIAETEVALRRLPSCEIV